MGDQKLKRRIVVLALLAVLILWVLWGNTALERSCYSVESERLPQAFDGFRIAQVSDLHNARMGEDNAHLIEMLRSAEPDIIAVTGDLIDSNHTDVDTAVSFMEQAVQIAPCYFITGNHEGWVSKSVYGELEEALTALGVTVLHDGEVLLEREGAVISLIGIDDPDFASLHGGGVGSTMAAERISALASGERFTILLSHRPEYFDTYVQTGFDLVLSGHAHGGQVRLPLVGGLVAPNQGLFPEYDAGCFSEKTTSMIVSRGIGNSVIPLRFNNRPELILVELKCVS